MEKFSFRRMWQFCRLQLCSTYFSRPWTAVWYLAVITGFCTLLPAITGDGSLSGMMSDTERLIQVLVTFMIVTLYQDLTSGGNAIDKMMVPASLSEKYVSLFAGTAIAVTATVLGASVIGSALYCAIGKIFHPDQYDGLTVLFFRNGMENWREILITCMMITALAWIIPLIKHKKKYRAWKIWAILLSYAAVLFLPGILKEAGLIHGTVARIASVAVMSVLTVMNVVAGYDMLAKFESDINGND